MTVPVKDFLDMFSDSDRKKWNKIAKKQGLKPFRDMVSAIVKDVKASKGGTPLQVEDRIAANLRKYKINGW